MSAVRAIQQARSGWRRFPSRLLSRAALGVLALGAAPVFAVPTGRDTAGASSAWVDPRVAAAVASGGGAPALVVFGAPADLAPARALADRDVRGRSVYDTLRADALHAQAPLVDLLGARGRPFRRFWIVNAVAVELDGALLSDVRRMPGVTRVAWNGPGGGPRAIPPGEALGPERVGVVAAPEWGVARVAAPWAWARGFTGQGVVVAGQDTGYDWDHPALVRSYRGYDPETMTADHAFNWHDAIHGDIGTPNGNACGYDSPAPCDDHGHGTHTMGTMTGNDLDPAAPGWPGAAANVVGIAPGATWIGCRNMDNGDGIPSTYIECFEWFVAPYPPGGDPMTDGDPSRAPDVVNNSWGCPPSEGCSGPEIEAALDAADAAGILVVVSAGNSGSACGSVDDPPAIYPAALAVGATSSSDLLAGFSSRGPVTYGGETFGKPDLSAPGVSVRSSVPGTGYGVSSGTSMAGPHVAGVAALLMSAAPELAGQTDVLKAVLTGTADPRLNGACGGDPSGRPNNLYGWGIVNAEAALRSLAPAGDCNRDGRVDAGDLSALPLEILDDDGALPADAPGGAFPGHPIGCDANADAAIDAGDVACAVLRVFRGTCG